MKTNMNTIIALVFFACLFSNSGKAQTCPYDIHNNMLCTLKVQVDFYDNCPGAPCFSQTQNCFTGVLTTFNCGSCGSAPLCDIVVTVLSPPSIFVDINNQSDTQPASGPCSTSGSITAIWGPGATTLNQ